MDMETERPIVNIVGEQVALGPIRDAHFEAIARWDNDYRTSFYGVTPLGPQRPEATATEFKEYLEKATNTIFALYEVETWQFIGYTGLRDAYPMYRCGEFGIMIGESDARGKGYGTEATRLVLDHAFLAIGLENVWLRTMAFNTAGIRAYEKAGFKHVGRLRNHVTVGGKRWDAVLMDIVADEFESPVLSRVLAPDEAHR